MSTTITMTSKGQFTLPVQLRRELGVLEAGDKLVVDYDKRNKRVIISKPVSVEELSTRLTGFIKPGTKPVVDVDAYYQQHRGKHIR